MGRPNRLFAVALLALPVLWSGCGGSAEPETAAPTTESTPQSGGLESSGVGPPVEADLGLTDEAVRQRITGLLEAARAKPGNPGSRTELGMGYEVAGLHEAALRSYQQAQAIQPGEPRWSYYLAQAHARLGDLEAAVEAMESVRRLNADYPPADLYLGSWLLDLGRVDEAQAAYRHAVELQPGNPAGGIGLARVHLARKEGGEAVAILEPLTEQYQDYPYLYQLLGLAYRYADRMDDARSALARGKPGAAPGWSDPWHDEKAVFQSGFGAGMLKADELMSRGRMAEAARLYEELRLERPDDLALLNNLSVTYKQTGREEDSFRILMEGLERHPDYYPFHLNAGVAFQRQGDSERALAHLDRAIELYPSLAGAHERKGNLLLRLRRFQEALVSYDTALRYDARNPGIYVNAGVLEAELKNWSRAEERFDQAVGLDPNLFPAWLGLGRSRAELGDLAGSETALARAGQLNPGHRALAATRERLEQLKAGQP